MSLTESSSSTFYDDSSTVPVSTKLDDEDSEEKTTVTGYSDMSDLQVNLKLWSSSPV